MNKNLIPVKTALFQNRLSKIVEQLNRDREVIPAQTKEAIIAEASRLLALFYKSVTGPRFQPILAVTGTKPEYQDYNTNFNLLKDDIDILFSELENLETVVLEQFNLITAQANRINSRIKKVSSRVSDYSLFSKLPIKNSIFFSDSFADTSKLEPGSSLLNATECEINQAEGIITLPINQSATIPLVITLKPSINSNSNGRAGNNEELDIGNVNDNIQVVLDNNPDTWFEYERVVEEDDGESLLLDFTVNLSQEEIINFIRINPNNFGTKTEIEIVDISTSTDGQIYKSVKDDFPITGFPIQDEENIFKLAPATSKFAGQGLFTFTPRFAKYVKLLLKQVSPYPIQTVQGTKFRYAIGVRDVDIRKLAYEATGEIVSGIFTSPVSIQKVALRTNQVPTQNSELATITHQISIDDGNSWLDISPVENIGVLNTPSAAPEIININTEDENSITTGTDVLSIRYKAVLKRLDDGFTSGSTSFAEEIQETTELKVLPRQEPWAIQLSQKPVIGSVGVLDTAFGSRGNETNKFLVGKGIGGKLSFLLPWEDLRLDLEKDSDNKISNKNIFRVFIGGEEWDLIPDILDAGATDKVFQVQQLSLSVGSSSGKKKAFKDLVPVRDGVPPGRFNLIFGDGVNGKSPPSNSPIELLFTPEKLYPIDPTSHASELSFPTSIDKETISIFRRGLILKSGTVLNSETNIQRLPFRNIVIDDDHPISFTDTAVFSNQVDFKNGLATPEGELLVAGDYSVDTDRGIIYSFTKSASSPGSVSFFYQDQVELSSTDWDWGDTDPIHHSVAVKTSAWVPNKVVGETVSLGVTRINLANLSVVQGSVIFEGLDGVDEEDNPFLKEVPFIDGFAELTNTIRTEEQLASLSPISNVATFTTTHKMSTDTNLHVSFSNPSVFILEVGSLVQVDTVGDYYIDRATSTVSVHTGGASVADPGKIIYYYLDPTKIENGSYSIDYKKGIVFTQRETPISTITVNYEYSDYLIYYNIAREVSPSTWELVDNTITFKSSEILSRSKIDSLAGSSSSQPLTYQVNYKFIATVRKNIEDLTDYFTPILKDYILQIITNE